MEIANLLDPKQYGKDLPSNSMDTISKFIQEYYPKESTTIWTQILQYKKIKVMYLPIILAGHQLVL